MLDHEMDSLALTADRGYVRVRDVVHVIREAGKTVALVGLSLNAKKQLM